MEAGTGENGGSAMRIARVEVQPCAPHAGEDRREVTYRDLFVADSPGRMSVNLVQVPPGGITHRHAHAWAQVNLVVAGAGLLEVDRVDHPVRQGDVVYIEPEEVHCYRNHGEEVLVILGVLGPRANDQPSQVLGAPGGN